MQLSRRPAWLVALSIVLVCACTSAPESSRGAPRTRGGEVARGGAAPVDLPAGAPGAVHAPNGSRIDFHSNRGQAEKIALLIGIDEYAPGTPVNFRRLSGCVRDTELVRDVLERRFDFPPQDILVLNNADATHENIVRAFREWLIARSGKDTEVLFWFSGHGSRIPDLSGSKVAERGGKESTFVAYDSRANGEDGAFDFSDDEMRSLLFAITRITPRVTVVTDSCHSGGGTRGVHRPGEPRIRAGDEGSRPLDVDRLRASFWPKDVALHEDDGTDEVEPDRYVHIAACSDTQLAQEIDTEDEHGLVKSHGALTFFLSQCLQSAQPTTSYRNLSDQTAVRLATQIPGQTVWREGALDRELFGARFRARPAGFLARALPGGELQIEAGSMLGLRKGSKFAVFDDAGKTRIGSATLVRAGAQSSFAEWTDAPAPPAPSAPSDLGGALRAVEESRPFGQSPLNVHFTDARIAGWFQGSERIVPQTGEPRRPDLLVAPDRDGSGLALFTPEGLRLWQHSTPVESDRVEFVGELESQVREELRFRALFALANDPGSVKVSARFDAPTQNELAQFVEGGRYAHVYDANTRLDEGSRASEFLATGALSADLRLAVLEVENSSASDVYVSVLSVAEDRGRNLIWPLGGQQDKVLPAGERQRICVNVTAHKDWNLTRPMRDRYLVIATSEAADFQPLTHVATLRSAAPSTRMPEMLALALEKPPTRGVQSVKVDANGWGIACVDLLVSEPSAP